MEIVWFKQKNAMKYADIKDTRSFRRLLADGLRHVRLPNGQIRVRKDWVDEYLEGLEAQAGRVDAIVDEVISELRPKKRGRNGKRR